MGWMSLSFDNLFVFETPRMVQIRDKWLGVPRFLLLLSIVLYIVLYETFLNEGYLLKEQPKGIVVSSLRRGEHHVPEALPYYCSTSAAMPDGTGPPCEFLDDLGVLLGEGNGGDPPEMGSMFITTRVSVSDSAVVPGCQRAFYSAEGKGGKVVLRNHDGEVCPEVPGYSKAAQRDYYVGDIEHFTIMFRHAIFGFGSGHTKYSTDVTGRAVFDVADKEMASGSGSEALLQAGPTKEPSNPDSDVNFLPRVSSSADVLKQLAQHGHVGYTHGDILTVERLLDCLGLGAHVLDLPSPEGAAAECDAPVSDLAPHMCPHGCYWVGPYCGDYNGEGVAGCTKDSRCSWDNETATCKVVEEHGHCVPKTMRYDGFVVLVTIEYSTPRWHSFDDVGYRYVAQVVPGAEFRAVQKTVTADGHFRFYNRHGVRVIVLQTGYVSIHFSLIELLKTLVGGAALLAVADRLTELLMRVLPRNRIYRTYKYITSTPLSDVKATAENPWGPLTEGDFTLGSLTAPRRFPGCAGRKPVAPPPKLLDAPPPLHPNRRKSSAASPAAPDGAPTLQVSQPLLELARPAKQAAKNVVLVAPSPKSRRASSPRQFKQPAACEEDRESGESPLLSGSSSLRPLLFMKNGSADCEDSFGEREMTGGSSTPCGSLSSRMLRVAVFPGRREELPDCEGGLPDTEMVRAGSSMVDDSRTLRGPLPKPRRLSAPRQPAAAPVLLGAREGSSADCERAEREGAAGGSSDSGFNWIHKA
eukprot:TRINITY_DN3464_c0_g1_i3.p1 TRINITY_DN3464_c0_g1~~TRINITY_DN3464_c0_g1_i3.p1  ORF type:complete len:752 (+),score=189.90 TRINITY_DN3464_c0_g1_i3:119-2374(+)